MTLPPTNSRIDDVAPLAPLDTAAEPKTLGYVTSVRGSQASVGLPAESQDSSEQARASVGKFLGVRSGKSLLIGLIANVASDDRARRGHARARLENSLEEIGAGGRERPEGTSVITKAQERGR